MPEIETDNYQFPHPYLGVDVIIPKDGKVLLIKRAHARGPYQGFWGLPGGWIEWGETAEMALKREAMEEIGVDIEVVRFIGKYFDTPGRHPSKSSFALPHICKILKGDPEAHQVEEVDEIGWFSFDEIKNMDLAYDHKDMLIYTHENGLLE